MCGWHEAGRPSGPKLTRRHIDDIVIANTQQIYNELVPDADLTQLFETLVDIAISLLVGDNLNFDIDIADVLGKSFSCVVL